MPRGLKDDEANDAAWEATRGAVVGAARWGAYAAVFSGAAYAFSPIYRGLTIQFKIFIGMSGMVLGSLTEADRRLRTYEAQMRLMKRQRIDRAMWEKYEEDFEEELPVSRSNGSGGKDENNSHKK